MFGSFGWPSVGSGGPVGPRSVSMQPPRRSPRAPQEPPSIDSDFTYASRSRGESDGEFSLR
eukprot:2739389-Pyramimonas_sp.AAC.1